MNIARVGGVAALGIGAAALLAACASQNANKSPEAVAADTMSKFDSKLPWTNGTQLDVRGESTRIDVDYDGQIRGTYDATRLLSSADNHTFGTHESFDPAIDIKGNGKATFNEIVQVARHYNKDGDSILSEDEAKQFDREMGVEYRANPFYDPFPEE